MQHNKRATKSSEIAVFAMDTENLTSTLGEVMGKYNGKVILSL